MPTPSLVPSRALPLPPSLCPRALLNFPNTSPTRPRYRSLRFFLYYLHPDSSSSSRWFFGPISRRQFPGSPFHKATRLLISHDDRGRKIGGLTFHVYNVITSILRDASPLYLQRIIRRLLTLFCDALLSTSSAATTSSYP